MSYKASDRGKFCYAAAYAYCTIHSLWFSDEIDSVFRSQGLWWRCVPLSIEWTISLCYTADCWDCLSAWTLWHRIYFCRRMVCLSRKGIAQPFS